MFVHVNNNPNFQENQTSRPIIGVKYVSDVDIIQQAHRGEWYDLRAAKTVTLKKGENALIPLGVKIQLPVGFEAILSPRSGTYKKYHVIQTNSIGVIDNQYRGEWLWSVYATEDTEIPKNERVCQFRVLPVQPSFEIVEFDELDETERGDGSFGSSGRI